MVGSFGGPFPGLFFWIMWKLNMNFFARLIISLGVVAGIAAGLLSVTYSTTAPEIAKRELEDQAKALQNVFFLQQENGKLALEGKEIAPGVTALFSPGDAAKPTYYAVTGQATGYNSGVPISLMVGFTGPAKDAPTLLQGYVDADRMPGKDKSGEYIVGFSVINSEETPGLGEKIKDQRPPYTWMQAFTGKKPAPNPDSSTDFQRQFRGRLSDDLILKKDGGELDAITASTITSRGVIAALRDASGKLHQALSAQ